MNSFLGNIFKQAKAHLFAHSEMVSIIANIDSFIFTR